MTFHTFGNDILSLWKNEILLAFDAVAAVQTALTNAPAATNTANVREEDEALRAHASAPGPR